MTGRERQLFYWTQEAKTQLERWREAQRFGDKEVAKIAKQQYISARKTLEELSLKQ